MQGSCTEEVPASFSVDPATVQPGQCVLRVPATLLALDATGAEDTWLDGLYVSKQGDETTEVLSILGQAAEMQRLWVTNTTLDGPMASGTFNVANASALVQGACPLRYPVQRAPVSNALCTLPGHHSREARKSRPADCDLRGVTDGGFGVLGAGGAAVTVADTTFNNIDTAAGTDGAVTATDSATVGLQSVAWSGTSGDGADCLAVDVGSALLADLATRDNMPTIDESGLGTIGPLEEAEAAATALLLQASDPRFLALQEEVRLPCSCSANTCSDIDLPSFAYCTRGRCFLVLSSLMQPL